MAISTITLPFGIVSIILRVSTSGARRPASITAPTTKSACAQISATRSGSDKCVTNAGCFAFKLASKPFRVTCGLLGALSYDFIDQFEKLPANEEDLLKKHYKDAKKILVDGFTEEYIESLLEDCGGNISTAAKRAGIDRACLHRLIKKHRMRRK